MESRQNIIDKEAKKVSSFLNLHETLIIQDIIKLTASEDVSSRSVGNLLLSKVYFSYFSGLYQKISRGSWFRICKK